MKPEEEMVHYLRLHLLFTYSSIMVTSATGKYFKITLKYRFFFFQCFKCLAIIKFFIHQDTETFS